MSEPFDSKLPHVGQLSEKEIIGRLKNIFGDLMPPSPFGPGDDCAIIDNPPPNSKLYATSDSVIMGVHFSPETSPERAGAKLLNRNASDIASMGGRPYCAITSAVFSKNLSLNWLDGFCKGLSDSASKLGVKIVGGDCASVKGDYFSMHLTMLGVSTLRPLLRTGASIGDKICVTGSLGLSFETGHHLDFSPRLREGELLAIDENVSACTDLSDGIASDILNLLPESAAAILDEASLPLRKFSGKLAKIENALTDGEDYELLFTYKGNPLRLSELFKSEGLAPISVIGEISPKGNFGSIILRDSVGNLKAFRGRGYSQLA